MARPLIGKRPTADLAEEERAFVERIAAALGRGGEPVAHRLRATDQLLHLRQLRFGERL